MISQKEKRLLLVLGVAVILIIVVLYFGLLRGDNPSNIVNYPDGAISSDSASSSEFINEATINYVSRINLDFNFLKSDGFASLDVNGNIPIRPQTSGRANPFVPY